MKRSDLTEKGGKWLRIADLAYLNLAKWINKVPKELYVAIIFIIGFTIRLKQYLANRSLWLDESFLAVNLRNRSYTQLIEKLDHNQVAPIGFLWAEKFIISQFDINEYTLRLLPFVASILSIVLVYYLAKETWNHHVAMISVFLFILSTNLTYYGSEVKQYGIDIFCGLLLFWFFYKYFKNRSNSTIYEYLTFTIIGILFIWFSNVAIIILASIGLNIIYTGIRKKEFKQILKFTPLLIFWIISFGIYFYLFIYENVQAEGMKNYWKESFLPTNTFSSSIEWLSNKLFNIFSNDINFRHNTIPIIIVFIIGLFLTVIKERSKTLLMLLPLLIHIILSTFQLYPFGGRVSLYITPYLIIAVAAGFYLLSFRYKNRYYGLTLVSILFLTTGDYRARAKSYFDKPYLREHIRPTLQYISGNIKKDDKIYVFYGSIVPFEFYKSQFNLEAYDCLNGIVDLPSRHDEFLEQFNSLNGRVWILFSHMYPQSGIDYIHNQIKKYQILDQFNGEGSYTILFNKIQNTEPVNN